MANSGWQKLVEGRDWCRGAGRYPIAAYSEWMPPPRIGWKPVAGHVAAPWSDEAPFAWQVSEYEEAVELRPGLEHVAGHVVAAMEHLGAGRPAHGIAAAKLENNPFWPEELARHAGRLAHERYVVLLPLALSRTQDDKGRVRWTLFGNSEQGPDRAFWKSFYEAPGCERPATYAVDFIRRLLQTVYGESTERLADLRALGFRILAGSGEPLVPRWKQDPLPSWTAPFLMREGEPIERVRYLLTFRPFSALPRSVRKAYLEGRLHLLPFPGSLLFWGVAPYARLEAELPLATQLPLLSLCERYEAVRGLRIPQSGWMHEPHPDHPEPNPHHGRIRNAYRRTHRWERVHRHEDALEVGGREDHVAHVLFSAGADDVGLYGKPMARNSQIWTHHYERLLDGPRADRAELVRAAEALREGGQFGYRFYFPPMQVSRHEVFWHRPLVAMVDAKTGRPRVLDDSPTGYFTAYATRRPDHARPVELWPDLLRRPAYVAAVQGFEQAHEHHHHQTAINARKLIDAWRLLGEKPLPRSFARQLLHIPKEQTLEQWIESLAETGYAAGYREVLLDELRRAVAPQGDPAVDARLSPLTFHRTATRRFEAAYWKTIAQLASGRFVNKENADCVLDAPSHDLRKHHHRDLDALGEYLLAYYRRCFAQHSAGGKAVAGDLPFDWQTDFDFPWSKGWQQNRAGQGAERDLLVMIPGRDRRRAVIMADHYDTAYVEDVFYPEKGGRKARIAAAGADDNHSATAALMLAAPIFCELSRRGLLGCDVWLVHLTGEEFPADCLGARHLTQWLIERTLRLRVEGRRSVDLSKVDVQGVYVLDMVAHNRDHDRDVFQISPGASHESLGLAWHAHVANMLWNAHAPRWNRSPARHNRPRGRRSADGVAMPEIAPHPHLFGEVRLTQDPRSSLFNTDGQIFSDAGVPVVLFMENYDINRVGYHDTHDTMANIDLDYGAGVAAVAIEAVARAAGNDAGIWF